MTIAPSSSSLSQLQMLATLMAPKAAEATADGATAATPDMTGKLWHVTIIKAGRALTGDEYPAEVLKESLDIFRNMDIFSFRFGEDAADGPAEGFHHLPEGVGDDPRGQPSANLIGQVTDDVWWSEENQAIEAFAAIDDSKVRDRLRNAYARGAIGKGADVDQFGFSIYADVLKQDQRVAKFIKGHSLDLVTRPAAGGAFVKIVAEAPPREAPMLKSLRAESSLTDAAMLRVILEEVSRRVDSIVFGFGRDEDLTPEQQKAALAELATEIIGTMGAGTSPDAVESAVLEHIEAARSKIDDPQEGTMDAATITKLVAETARAEVAKAKAEDEASAARAQSPVETLKAWLESLQGEELASALAQVQSLVGTMGGGAEGESAAADKFAELTAELKAVTEEKDAKTLRSRLSSVVEGLVGATEETPDQKELKRMRAEMNDMAMTRALDTIAPDLKLDAVAASAAMKLADLSDVTVKGLEVAGLREALEAAIVANPFLVTKAAAAVDPGTAPATPAAAAAVGAPGSDVAAKAAADALAKSKLEAETATAAAATAKAEADRLATVAAEHAATIQGLSAAVIRESAPAGGVVEIPAALDAKIKRLQARCRGGGDTAAQLELMKINKALRAGA